MSNANPTTSTSSSTGTKELMRDEDPDIIIKPLQLPSQQGERVKVVPKYIPSGAVTPSGGRIKAAPVCRIPSLRKEHMTSDQMSKWCFSPDDVWSLKIEAEKQKEEDKMETDNSSQSNGYGTGNGNNPISPREWQQFKKNILIQNESRNGRDTQKFATDAQGQLLRLTTGCVPIMNDGKILLISSSRKGEWILPKGGWESDESMQESALRETYEEGGILGVIGPKLGGIEFETRKAKKRRLELESLKKKCEIAYGNTLQPEASVSSIVSVQSNSSSLHDQSEDDKAQVNGSANSNGNNSSQSSREISNDSQTTISSDGKSNISSPSGKDCLATKIRNELDSNGESTERHDDSASIASSEVSSSCTHVRLCMFPLYVLEVRENWPESGRARKVVDIDTAIEIMSQRPEFHQVLIEVKKNGLHLKPHQQVQDVGNVGTKTIPPTALSNDSKI